MLILNNKLNKTKNKTKFISWADLSGSILSTVGDGGTCVSIRLLSNQKSNAGTIKQVPKGFISILDKTTEYMDLQYPISEVSDQVVKLHNQLIKDNGIVPGTKRFNIIRTFIINSLEGKEQKNPPYMAVSRVHKFPSNYLKCWTYISWPRRKILRPIELFGHFYILID